MAEAKSPDRWTSNVLCRYYLHGVCRQGATCGYSHDLDSKPDMLCKFYRQGNCSYGARCKFDHVRPTTSSNKNTIAAAQTPGKFNQSQTSASVSETRQSNMVKLTKSGSKQTPKTAVTSVGKTAAQWVKAAEFVPGQKWKGAGPVSYLDAAQSGVEPSSAQPTTNTEGTLPPQEAGTKEEMCPYAAHGECRFGENCTYMHGDRCDMCGKAVLHPDDKGLRDKHIEDCVKDMEEDMELSFAVQRSKEKSCGICMEVIWEKAPPTEQRFGLLSNCNHVFCLSCIRKWRSAKQFENKTVRACPECRVKSDFVTPSKYWVDDKGEKLKLIEGYKKALSMKKCKYFDEGRGECPFNENCFYLHAYPDGRRASPKPMRRRRRHTAEGGLDYITQLILWDFLEERNSHLIEFNTDDFIFHLNFADSSDDDSEFSDFDSFTY